MSQHIRVSFNYHKSLEARIYLFIYLSSLINTHKHDKIPCQISSLERLIQAFENALCMCVMLDTLSMHYLHVIACNQSIGMIGCSWPLSECLFSITWQVHVDSSIYHKGNHSSWARKTMNDNEPGRQQGLNETAFYSWQSE